jgi:protein-tyrosine phosphatase
MNKQVLFLCTANYYRSRFAEHLFNWLAGREVLDWRADSRGLAVDGWGNIGPISCFTIDALQERGIPISGNHRYPRPLAEADLEQSQLVVAVKEVEHRRLMAEQFPHWADRIEYWQIHDIDCAPPEEAIPLLEQHVRSLVQRLGLRRARGGLEAAPDAIV